MTATIDYTTIDLYDYDTWLRVPPPAQFGPAIHTLLRAILDLDDGQRQDINQALAATHIDADAEMNCDDAFNDHPIGETHCGPVTYLNPWVDAVYHRVGEGPALVLTAVACRDHKLITDGDFRALTDWWTQAGHTLPEPISSTDRAALNDWWECMEDES